MKILELELERIVSIQAFAFQLSKKIHEQHSVKICRSHVYELIAVIRGYKTYNSFVAQNFILKASHDDSEVFYEHKLLNILTLEILYNTSETDFLDFDEDELHWGVGYEYSYFLDQIKKIILRIKSLLEIDISEESYLEIAKTIYREILGLNIEVINFRAIREELSYINFENGLVAKNDFDDEYFDFEEIGANFEKILFYAKGSNNIDAYALLGAYYRYLANKIAPYGRDGSNFGSHWDNSKQKYVDSNVTKYNKDKYEEYIAQAEIFESHIKKSPLSLYEIDLDADTETLYKNLLYLCNQGNTEAIEYFLYEKIFKNSGEAWLYIYLAQLCGVDFTQSDYSAINAYTGEDYDDYGPMEVIGREAIQDAVDLSKLDRDKDDLARKIAKKLFEKI